MNTKVMQSLRQVFAAADSDGSGSLDRAELRSILKQPSVKNRLDMLELPVRDLDLLFTLLDGDDIGLVPTDVFFRGCTRTRGQALASDLYQLTIDMQRNTGLMKDNENFTVDVNTNLGKL